MSVRNVLCKVVFCIAFVVLSQSELKAQWDPTNTEGLVDWASICGSLNSKAKKKAMETLLAAEIPKEKLSDPLVAKLFKGKWDMFRNPGTSGFMVYRDPNKKEYELVFRFGNNMEQKRTVIAILCLGQTFKSFSDADFFSVESIQVKKLMSPWTFESNTFPAGTEVITMSLSEIFGRSLSESRARGLDFPVHTWNCTLVPYKNGWSGKLEDVYQRIQANSYSEYRYNAYRYNAYRSQSSLNTFKRIEDMMGYNRIHLVYLIPSVEKKDDQTESASEDNTGVSDPEF